MLLFLSLNGFALRGKNYECSLTKEGEKVGEIEYTLKLNFRRIIKTRLTRIQVVEASRPEVILFDTDKKDGKWMRGNIPGEKSTFFYNTLINVILKGYSVKTNDKMIYNITGPRGIAFSINRHEAFEADLASMDEQGLIVTMLKGVGNNEIDCKPVL